MATARTRAPTKRSRARAVETEAKFLLRAPKEAEALLEALGTEGAPRVEPIEDDYYDTEDGALLAAGWAYRVRSLPGRIEATLKAVGRAGPDGVHRREEITERVASPDPQPALLRAGRLRSTLEAWVGKERLERVAAMRTSRSTWTVSPRPGLRVEACVDRTSASCGRARRRWTEVEVELKEGAEDALSRLVADLERATDLHTVVEGKLARILEAAGRSLPTADEIALARLAGPGGGPSAGDPTAVALRRVLAAGALRLERALAGGTQADAVHDVRTSSRRLRSTLRLYREADRGERDEASAELRALARAAGAVRDEQVALDALPEGADWAGGNATLAAVLGARARAAAARLRRRLERGDARSLPRRVAEVGARSGARRSPPFAVAGAARVPREAERALADVARLSPAKTTPEALHALRLSVKRARYAAEAFSGAFGAPVGRFVAATRRLQDDLGTVQDEVTLRAALRRALARLPTRSPDREAAARAAEAALAEATRRTQAAVSRVPARVEAALGEKALRRLGGHLLGRAARASAASAATT